MSRVDPFALKRFPKVHPVRLAFTIWGWLIDRYSGLRFESYSLPIVPFPDALPDAPQADWNDTQVTPEQARNLLRALHLVDHLSGCIVEVGSWRGVTTSYLAAETPEPVLGIDPFIGPENEKNLRVFERRTQPLPNVSLIRNPFGAALKDWKHGHAKFAFIDGSHNYGNVSHDIEAVQEIMQPGGIIALHDTDNPTYPGCRKAVYETQNCFDLVAHVPNLTIFRCR
jgi:predicted O-methyltransferase YrrM